MNEIKESMVSSFQQTSKQGVLCEESMRGMRFNVVDCELHTDAIHRGGGQIMPASRRLFYALELLCEPTLVEPIFNCEITAPSDCMGGVYQSLNQRRGMVVEEIQITGTPLNLVHFFLFRSKHSCLSLNPLASPACSEETPKEKPSLSVSSTTGRSSRDSHSQTPKQESWSLTSEREKGSSSNFPKLLTTSTECDVNRLSFLFLK